MAMWTIPSGAVCTELVAAEEARVVVLADSLARGVQIGHRSERNGGGNWRQGCRGDKKRERDFPPKQILWMPTALFLMHINLT
jgi:hypothetical protein